MTHIKHVAGVLQCVAEWCSVVQRVAYMTWFISSVLQCVAVGCGVVQRVAYATLLTPSVLLCVAVRCSVLHTWHKSSRVLQCVAAWCMVPCVAYASWLIPSVELCCSVLQSVTVSWSMLQRVAVCVPNSHARPTWHVILNIKYLYRYEICDMALQWISMCRAVLHDATYDSFMYVMWRIVCQVYAMCHVIFVNDSLMSYSLMIR